MHGFIIAGTNSGCGKTTITIGLMALLKSMRKSIAPFKTGPDYIDPAFHEKVLNTPSYNLDSFMLTESAIKYLFHKHSQGKDICIAEGVMGMYDGMGIQAVGSTYELSRLLNLPVILIINCKGLYQSVTAIIKGFSTLKENTNIKGVILNHVPGKDYYSFLKDLIEKECDVACVGYVPTNKDFSLESRHLGLIQAEEVDTLNEKIQQIKTVFERTIDVKRLMEITKINDIPDIDYALPKENLYSLNIAVAYDKAFSFYYKDNLELLKECGARIQYFSPLKDTSLPANCNCLYLGGGYPEVFAKELAQNKSLLHEIHERVSKGFPVYAECGGMMYLCNQIIDLKGNAFDMCGIYNANVKMTTRLKRFGYAIADYKGVETKCHEFHRSEIIVNEEEKNYSLQYQLRKPAKDKHWECGLKVNNCLGAYAHVHFYANPQFFEKIIELWKRQTI